MKLNAGALCPKTIIVLIVLNTPNKKENLTPRLSVIIHLGYRTCVCGNPQYRRFKFLCEAIYICVLYMDGPECMSLRGYLWVRRQ